MAVTKIKPVHTTLKAAINYIVNPKKTEEGFLIDSYGCTPQTAHLEFAFTAEKNLNSSSVLSSENMEPSSIKKGKEGKNKKNSVLAYHVIQSFKPDEITPLLAHEIGMEFARSITDKKYEFIVSTHVDKHHIHNHIIFNAVDFREHKKYHSDFKSYKKIREISDSLCAEHGLSVITNPVEKGLSYFEWMKKNEGISYKESLRKALDNAVLTSSSFDDLIIKMERDGYAVKFGKYISFKAPGQERFTRCKSLGSSYTEDALKARILDKVNGRSSDTVPSSSTPYIGLISAVSDSFNALSSSKNTSRSDLKKLNATYLYLKEHGIDSLEALSSSVTTNKASISSVRSKIRALESEAEPYEQYLKYASTYSDLKGVYDRYKGSGMDKDFAQNHRREIILFEQALSFLKSSPLYSDSPISLSKLKSQLASLKESTNSLYEELDLLKENEKSLTKVRKNIESILGESLLASDIQRSSDMDYHDVSESFDSEKAKKKEID